MPVWATTYKWALLCLGRTRKSPQNHSDTVTVFIKSASIQSRESVKPPEDVSLDTITTVLGLWFLYEKELFTIFKDNCTAQEVQCKCDTKCSVNSDYSETGMLDNTSYNTRHHNVSFCMRKPMLYPLTHTDTHLFLWLDLYVLLHCQHLLKPQHFQDSSLPWNKDEVSSVKEDNRNTRQQGLNTAIRQRDDVVHKKRHRDIR